MFNNLRQQYLGALCSLCLILFAAPFQNTVANENKIALVNINAGPTNLPSLDPELYKVKIVSGKYYTKSGAARTYTLYMPEKNSLLQAPPYPLLVLIHGFLMTGHQHSNNAKYFAERGFIALAPDMTKILLGDENRTRNVQDILDQISWLIKQSTTPNSSLYSLIDSNRIGIAGNSAGGAVCLELLLQAQKTNVPIHAMCSLDGVPWDRTKSQMENLKPVNILSLRAEPGLCNYYSRMLPYLDLLKFPYNDVKINGAHHCDVENPTSLGCRCICGVSNAKNRGIFQHLTYLYFRDVFSVPEVATSASENFIETVSTLKNGGLAIAKLNQLQPVALAGNQKSASPTY